MCGSDLHYARHGANGSYALREPLILGHEIVGLIDWIGSAVEGDFRPGEPVAVQVSGVRRAAGLAPLQEMQVVQFTDRRSLDTGSELRRFIDYRSATVSWRPLL
ncbi:alcohol dehydrogenase catalytic domain-containing protein [Streptomyces scopuliridis]|uniref:alcohol dehydrogenase catalytic domain-containing protein n=1 Tax=Streptomyces scopuliridis TaxID=452529 RepID=UPI00389AABCC